jgi:hypothetical protein
MAGVDRRTVRMELRVPAWPHSNNGPQNRILPDLWRAGSSSGFSSAENAQIEEREDIKADDCHFHFGW